MDLKDWMLRSSFGLLRLVPPVVMGSGLVRGFRAVLFFFLFLKMTSLMKVWCINIELRMVALM